MPRYMLDTNMCIYLMKNQPEEVARRFAQCCVGDVVMSAITYAELEYGVAASANPTASARTWRALSKTFRWRPSIAPPLKPTADPAGDPGQQQDHLDKLIAAHAVALKVTVVTNNMRDFAKYPGVVTENWLVPQVR